MYIQIRTEFILIKFTSKENEDGSITFFCANVLQESLDQISWGFLRLPAPKRINYVRWIVPVRLHLLEGWCHKSFVLCI